jgi:hypothetical protein
LRQWLAMDREFFYDEDHVAIIPMGLSYNRIWCLSG